MHHKSLLAAAVVAACALAVSAQGQEQRIRLGPSAVLSIRRDLIEDTDYSSIWMQSSSAAMPATLFLGCYGRHADAHVNFDDNRDGTLFIFRFNSEKPDSFPATPGEPMRMWGGGSVRLVVNPPTGIGNVPKTAIPRFVRGVRSGGRVVVRRVGQRGTTDTWFELEGVARGLERLSCLSAPVREEPRVLGRTAEGSDEDYDSPATPADSAEAARGLDALRSTLDQEILPYLLGNAYVNAAGSVDSVRVFTGNDEREDRYVAYIRTIRFHPAQKNGQPVRSQWMFHIYKAELVPRP